MYGTYVFEEAISDARLYDSVSANLRNMYVYVYVYVYVHVYVHVHVFAYVYCSYVTVASVTHCLPCVNMTHNEETQKASTWYSMQEPEK